MADAAEPLDLAPIKARLANYASGPKSDLTGQMIARDLAHAVPSLVAEVERLRALAAGDDAMVERAARAVYGVAFADATVGWGMASQSMRDTCRTLADAALEAALGVES